MEERKDGWKEGTPEGGGREAGFRDARSAFLLTRVHG